MKAGKADAEYKTINAFSLKKEVMEILSKAQMENYCLTRKNSCRGGKNTIARCMRKKLPGCIPYVIPTFYQR